MAACLAERHITGCATEDFKNESARFRPCGDGPVRTQPRPALQLPQVVCGLEKIRVIYGKALVGENGEKPPVIPQRYAKALDGNPVDISSIFGVKCCMKEGSVYKCRCAVFRRENPPSPASGRFAE